MQKTQKFCQHTELFNTVCSGARIFCPQKYGSGSCLTDVTTREQLLFDTMESIYTIDIVSNIWKHIFIFVIW